jgi:hypothetical protein
MPTTPIPQILPAIAPAARRARLRPDQTALEYVVLRLLLGSGRRHQLLLLVLLAAELFALLDILFDSLINARQSTCDINFAQMKR